MIKCQFYISLFVIRNYLQVSNYQASGFKTVSLKSRIHHSLPIPAKPAVVGVITIALRKDFPAV
jgi:hypothetical protein